MTVENSKFLFTAPAITDKRFVAALADGTEFKRMHEALASTQRALHALRDAEELHRLLFEKVPHPRFVCDARSLRLLAVNEAAVRRYGYSHEELLAMKLPDLCVPDSRKSLRRYLQRAGSHPTTDSNRREFVFRHQKKDSGTIDVAVDSALLSVGNRRLLLFMAQDVTAKRWLQAQQAITRALAECTTLAEASPRVFKVLCETIGCDWGELWRADPACNVLRCTQTWHPASNKLRQLERATRGAVYTRGQGIPGVTWARNKPVWLTEVMIRFPRSPREDALRNCGFRTAIALPIRLNNEVLGVVAVFTRQLQPPEKHLLRLLRDICSQIGQVMGRRRAERQMVEISEREQQRIGQDLHDGLCQRLAGIAYMASDLQSKLKKKSLSETATAARIAVLARETATQARQVARGLNPVKLGATGLTAALDALTRSIKSMFSISCRFEYQGRIAVSDHETAVHLYRIAQEAVHNAITHGKAQRITVSLRRQRDKIVLRISDNGRGLAKSSGNGHGTGIENMNYRAKAIGAQLRFASRPGGGTVMHCGFSQRNGRLT